jgi:intracellular sulfur oxidation DsrE/DsrF family protein
VCNLTTRRYTQMIAKEAGVDAEAVYKELTANTVAPATFVPAGVVTVTRAQERGYALVSIG